MAEMQASQETAAQKVERLKGQIARKLAQRAVAMGGVNPSVERAEAVLAQVRARLMGGQAAVSGRSAVREWMAADREKES
jgi:hypothetical protein